MAITLMLPAALLALRHRPDWTALVVTVPVLALSVHAVAILVWRRVEWLMAGGTGLPPVRLDHEGTIFGALAVPAFAVMGALPVALLIPHRRLRRAILIGLAVVAVPLTLLSGSRSAWLAAAVAGLVLAAPAVARRVRPSWSALTARSRRLRPRDVGLAVAGLALLAVGIAFIAPRLTDVRSLVFRGYLWRDTLAAWSQDPVFGIGPGSMPLARQAAAPPLSFPVRQPHSHDVALGILGDAGLVGLAAALALFITFVVVAGPWRTRSLAGRAAFAVLMGFAAGMLFEDLTFLPAFNLLVIVLAAMALLDAGAVRWVTDPARCPLAGGDRRQRGGRRPGGGHGGGRRGRHRLPHRNRCRERRPLARGLRRVPPRLGPRPMEPGGPEGAGRRRRPVGPDRRGTGRRRRGSAPRPGRRSVVDQPGAAVPPAAATANAPAMPPTGRWTRPHRRAVSW